MIPSPSFADPFARWFSGAPPEVLQSEPVESEGGEGCCRRLIYASRGGEGETAFENRVEAMIGFPSGPGPHPALLHLHGGMGGVEPKRVAQWMRRGYVVIAPELPGIAKPDAETPSSGPWKELPYGEGRWGVTPDASASTIFQGVLAALQALALLRTQPEVDPQRIGIVGISWGGYTTLMVSALVPGWVKAAFSNYGCGFYEWTAAGRELEKRPEAERDRWLATLDPGRRAQRITVPVFIAAATNDFFFEPPAVEATLGALDCPAGHLYAANDNHELSVPGGAPKENAWAVMEGDFFAWHLRGEGAPFPQVRLSRLEGFRGRLEVTAPVASAVFWWTPDSGDWRERRWESLPLAVPAGEGEGAGVVEFAFPEALRNGGVGFASVSQERPVTVSGRLVFF